MLFKEDITSGAEPFLPLLITALVVAVLLTFAHWVLIARNPELGNERLFPRQLVMLGLTFTAILAIVLALPVSDSSRDQLITLFGLIASGILAFASTTIFANLMAGIMLRVTKPFHTGDFIQVGDHFGRVVERGLLDTEIQTENRELTAIPNTFLITHPVSAMRSSGTIVSSTLSLGYDIHHTKVESLLMDAAKASGLEEAFVQILELGDYSVTYKVSGMLTDVKSVLTVRSNLCRSILDTLHGHSIEILSPTFMSQRQLRDDSKILPTMLAPEPAETLTSAEELVFDKAEQAEQAEKVKQQFLSKIQEYKDQLENASEEDKKRLEELIKKYREQLKVIDKENIDPDNR